MLCRQIEGKIVEISRLQEVFADKVLQQVYHYYLLCLSYVFYGCITALTVTTAVRVMCTLQSGFLVYVMSL